MATCIECGATLAPDEPPRFDVLAPDYDADDPDDVRGPYCAQHFAATTTAAIIRSGPEPAPVAAEPPVDADEATWEDEPHER